MSNDDAIKLYENFGFKRDRDTRKKYYRETNEDAIVMHLRVGDGAELTTWKARSCETSPSSRAIFAPRYAFRNRWHPSDPDSSS